MKAKRVPLQASAVGTATDSFRGCSMFASAPPAGSGVQDTSPRPARQALSNQWAAGVAATSLPPERDSPGDRGGRAAGRPSLRGIGAAALKELTTPPSSRGALRAVSPPLPRPSCPRLSGGLGSSEGSLFGRGAERGLPAVWLPTEEGPVGGAALKGCGSREGAWSGLLRVLGASSAPADLSSCLGRVD